MNNMEAWREELYHHGIKGQKWGVRRFQNPDGSFNAAGKERYFSKGSGENYQPVKQTKSLKGNIHRLAAKNYALNEKTYAKSNPTLSSMNKAAKEEALKKAEAADKVRSEKLANKERLATEKRNAAEEKKKAAVDVSAAKNSATRRVAEDYHRLTDKEFAGKYHTTKKVFAKRYQKTKGDTYSLGLKKQAAAIAFLNYTNGKSIGRTAADIAKATMLSNSEQKALDNGHEFVASSLAFARDLPYSKIR